MKKLVIIDGKSVFYRGYYAMGALSRADGTPTGGVYGFATIAMELVSKLQPQKVVVAWDKAKTSISKRKALYDGYKAGRAKPPEDFYAQIPLLKDLIHDLGWGFLECDNYEADDIIGTLARQASKEGYEVIIISSDLDMLQIVDEKIKMYRLLKGFSQLEEIDVPALEEKYGIRKDQFLDLKSLKGDTSDNIPGVPGVGEKTAVKLLAQYGDLDGVYAHLDEIKGSLRQKLADGKKSAYLSQKLAQIMFDAPVTLGDVPDLIIDGSRILAALKKLEFNSLVRKYAKVLEGGSNTAENEAKTGVEPVEKPVENSKTTEADGREAKIAENQGPGEISEPAEKPNSSEASGKSQLPDNIMIDSQDITPLIEYDVKKTMHAEKRRAYEILEGHRPFWDLNQAGFLLDPLKRNVNEVAGPQIKFHFGETEEDREKKIALYREQMKQFQELPKLKRVYDELDRPMIPVLYKMEEAGIKVSREYFSRLKKEYTAEVAALEQQIFDATTIPYLPAADPRGAEIVKLPRSEFNINSPMQLSEVLFEKLRLPTKGLKKTTRGFSTGAKELEKLKGMHPMVPLLVRFREATKLLGTYINPLPQLADRKNRIHTTFTQNITATGRLSSVNPNLQNIPVRTEEGRRIREGFIAEKGCKLIQADYSQFELRLAAVLAGDQALIDDFNADLDIHSKTAADVFKVPLSEVTKDQRRAAKAINFGVLYGMSAKGLADQTGMRMEAAGQFIADYFEVRAPIRRYLDRILKQAQEEGYVETYFGRRRPTPDVHSASYVIRQAAERAAMNMPIQGTEADLMKRAMIRLDQILPSSARMVLQIHDSLVIECEEGAVPEVSELLRTTMETVAPELPVKLAVEVKVGENLGEV